MPIPTQFDRAIAEIDDLGVAVLNRLRIYHRAGPNRDPASIRAALQDYVTAVMRVVNGPEI